MPRPVNGVSIPNPMLGALAYEYAIDAAIRGFIADIVLPVFETNEKNGSYPIIPKEVFGKLQDTKRNARSRYGRSDWKFELGSYACEEHGWEEAIDDEERKLYASLFEADEVATMRAVDVLLRNRENRAAELLFNTSSFSNSAAEVEWNDLSNSNPKKDFDTAADEIYNQTGLEPNGLIISRKVFKNLLKNKAFLAAGNATLGIEFLPMERKKQLLADFFEVERVIVGNGIKDTAKKGKDRSSSNIWSDSYAMAGIFAKNPRDLREPCVGRSMLWTADSPQVLTTESYREEDIRSDVFRVRNNIDEVLVFSGAGYILTGITK